MNAPRNEVAVIRPPRLPYPAAVEERFGIDKAGWKALVEAVFPAAQSADSVILALSYCKARKLDPFKRVIHIVPVWDSQQKRMVETVWPGIAELRTTAFRTGDYAGRDPSEFGPTQSRKVGSVQIEFPEWAQVTVYRMVKGVRCPFPGPRVYWLEAYAQQKRDDPSPNSMWAKRARGQLDKCAEAAALRAAFPEEIGGEMIDDEAHGRFDSVDPAPPRPTRADFREAAAAAPTVTDAVFDEDGVVQDDGSEADPAELTIELPRTPKGAPDWRAFQDEIAALLTAHPGRAGDIQDANQHHLDDLAREDAVRRGTITELFVGAAGAGEIAA